MSTAQLLPSPAAGLKAPGQTSSYTSHTLEATEFQDPEVMARQILAALPQVIAILPPAEVRTGMGGMGGVVGVDCGSWRL